MSSHVVSLFIVMSNLQLCLLVGYIDDRMRKDRIYLRKEKLPVLYYSIQMARCEKG